MTLNIAFCLNTFIIMVNYLLYLKSQITLAKDSVIFMLVEFYDNGGCIYVCLVFHRNTIAEI